MNCRIYNTKHRCFKHLYLVLNTKNDGFSSKMMGFHLQQLIKCVCVYLTLYLWTVSQSSMKFTTHPCNSNRWAPGCPPTKCAASVSARAFLSCCELSRAKRNLSSNNGQHCRYRGWDVWQNPIKIQGEATKNIDLQKKHEN